MTRTGYIIRIAILVICAIVFFVGSFMLIRLWGDYQEAQDVYESVNDGFRPLPEDSEGESDSETEGETLPEDVGVQYHVDLTEEMKEHYAYFMNLKAQYPNVVGYVSVPSVSIRYPVVQTDNNDYYLTHLITGDVSNSGAIFLDSRCEKDPITSKNLVIYGHNMNDGSMFHNLEDLFSRETFLGATVEYVCEQGVFFYKPLSVYRADGSYPFARYGFSDDEAYLAFCRNAVSLSRFEESGDVVYGADSGVITLITCANSITSKTARYVFQAVLDTAYLPEE